jgi:hypothetical protein
MFGQDIMDALFMISAITGAYLVFGATPAADLRTSSEARRDLTDSLPAL